MADALSPVTTTNILTQAQIAGYWIAAGGPATVAPIAAAITRCESSYNANSVQQGVPYSQQGVGLWQITPPDSVASVGTDYQLLDPMKNAQAAVAKYRAAGNSFSPWVTYNNGCYKSALSPSLSPVAPSGNSSATANAATSEQNAATTFDNGECAWSLDMPIVGQFCVISKTGLRHGTGFLMFGAGLSMAVVSMVVLVGFSLAKPAGAAAKTVLGATPASRVAGAAAATVTATPTQATRTVHATATRVTPPSTALTTPAGRGTRPVSGTLGLQGGHLILDLRP